MLTTAGNNNNIGGGSPLTQKAQDFQKVAELINRFAVNTAHLMNSFAADCDVKLAAVARQLQRVEAQVQLMEYKLDSLDREDGGGPPKASGADAGSPTAGSPSGPAPAALPAPSQLARRGANLPLPGKGVHAPPMPSKGGAAAPPAPNAGGPPLPAGVAPLAIQGPPKQIAPGAPPMPAGSPPAPPPMPVAAGLTVKTHPRLAGYFRMAEGGVPPAAVKARMAADGFNPAWFDTPNAPSPLPAQAPPPKRTAPAGPAQYDSD